MKLKGVNHWQSAGLKKLEMIALDFPLDQGPYSVHLPCFIRFMEHKCGHADINEFPSAPLLLSYQW